MSICAAMIVYNEEARIDSTLKSALWCDEIVVLDKQSTDRTREIASRYTNKIIQKCEDEYDPRELEIILENTSCEWVILMVASDVIHPKLATQIRTLTDDPDFGFDVIHVPYRRYVLGLESKNSPWYSELHPAIFRKRVHKTNHNEIHGAIAFDTERHFKMANSTENCMYHLTHASVDIMMSRHLRYCKAEGRLFPPEMTLWKACSSIFKATCKIIFNKKSLIMGWDGVALSVAYVMYWMLRFLYIWEARCSKAPEIYTRIREQIASEWLKTEKGSTAVDN